MTPEQEHLHEKIEAVRQRTRHQAFWYPVKYEEYWQLLDLLDEIIGGKTDS